MTWFLDKEFLETLDLNAYSPTIISQYTAVSLEEASNFVSPTRAYTIKSNPHYGFLAGNNKNGLATLLFISDDNHYSNIFSVTFNLDETISHQALKVTKHASWDDIIQAAEKECGFIHTGQAQVSAFKHPTIWSCALVPFPFDLHDDALGYSEEEDLSTVRTWIEAGSYVLHWGNAHYMNIKGEVISS